MERNGDLPELPKDWVWTKLGEIVDTVKKVVPQLEPDKKFLYLDIASIDNRSQRIVEPKRYAGRDAPSRARQVVKTGDILFSTVRTYLRNMAMVGDTYDGQVASTGFCVIRPTCPVDERFVFFLTQTDSFLNPLTQLQRGTSYPAVRDSDVLAQSVPLPPVAEQRRIVTKIEELFTQLDAGMAALRKAQAQIKRYRQAVLKAAVEGKLTAAWREAHKGELEPASVLLERIRQERRAKGKELPAPSDTTGLPELPEGWCWASVESLGEVSGGLTKNSKRAVYPQKLPYLRVANVYAAELRLDNVSNIGIHEAETERVLLRAGDLLVVEGNGSVEQIGRVAIWDGSISPCVHQNHIIKVRFSPVEIAEYVLLWLLSVSGRNQISAVASSTSGLYTLSLSKVSSLLVALPPLAEQHQIVEEVERRLSVADEIEKAVGRSLKQAARLRQSILKKAFEGRLVPQDPADEPAAVLLERIQAARRGVWQQGKLA